MENYKGIFTLNQRKTNINFLRTIEKTMEISKTHNGNSNENPNSSSLENNGQSFAAALFCTFNPLRCLPKRGREGTSASIIVSRITKSHSL